MVKVKHLYFPETQESTKAPLELLLSELVLGRGMYGSVQFARSQTDRADVFAVKVIPRSKLKNERALSNLVNEITIMSEINSPNVVALKHATKTKKNYYLAMELCNGGDLQNYVKHRGGYLPEQESRLLFR